MCRTWAQYRYAIGCAPPRLIVCFIYPHRVHRSIPSPSARYPFTNCSFVFVCLSGESSSQPASNESQRTVGASPCGGRLFNDPSTLRLLVRTLIRLIQTMPNGRLLAALCSIGSIHKSLLDRSFGDLCLSTGGIEYGSTDCPPTVIWIFMSTFKYDRDILLNPEPR